MKGLIEQLKKEHTVLLDVFGEIKRLGTNTIEGQAKLLQAKEVLLAHIKKEDEEFYPDLKKAAEINQALQLRLTYFAEDMKMISKYAFEYFDTHSEETDEADSGKAIESFMIILDSRIQREEQILFQDYENL